MILFQYMKLQCLTSCFENGVYASKLQNVNDPYEGFGISYPDQYRICCMTKSNLKMLMWAYYVNHNGCCVGFEVGNGFEPVTYSDSFTPHAEMENEEIISSLYTKGKEWSHEEEYRAVYYRPTADPLLWLIKDENIYYRANVVSVTFGLTAEYNSEYMKTLRFLKSYKSIECSKCKLKNGQYQLYKDKQFNIDLEIDRIEKMRGSK